MNEFSAAVVLNRANAASLRSTCSLPTQVSRTAVLQALTQEHWSECKF